MCGGTGGQWRGRGVSLKGGQSRGHEDRAGLQGPGERTCLPRWPAQPSAQPSPVVAGAWAQLGNAGQQLRILK